MDIAKCASKIIRSKIKKTKNKMKKKVQFNFHQLRKVIKAS